MVGDSKIVVRETSPQDAGLCTIGGEWGKLTYRTRRGRDYHRSGANSKQRDSGPRRERRKDGDYF